MINGLMLLLEENAPNSMEKKQLQSFSGLAIALVFNMTTDDIVSVASPGQDEMCLNNAGKVVSHLDGVLSRTVAYLQVGIKPVYVFEGLTPALKKQELSKRDGDLVDGAEKLTEDGILMEGDKTSSEKSGRRYAMVTEKHIEECKKLLGLMGVPVVEAPSEAAAYCAALCKSEKVYAVASEEMDSLTFGAPRFILNLFKRNLRKSPVQYELKKVLDELKLTMNEFIDLCILCGCDYCSCIKGLHLQAALKLIHEYGTIEKILDSNEQRYQIPDKWDYRNARLLFEDSQVLPEEVELKWSDLDEEGLVNFLVTENGFKLDTVQNAIGNIKAAKSYSTSEST